MKKVVLTATCLLLCFAGLAQKAEPGLIGEYFFLGGYVREFPELQPQQKPNLKRVDKTIDFPKAARMAGVNFTNDFYVHWTGKIRIPTSDTYTFFLESDDGSQLFIYDRKVVDNGGPHGMKEASGQLELPAGDHPLRIDFFQGRSLVGCRLFWESKAIAKQIVPAEALVHQAIVPAPKPEPGPGLVGDYYDMRWKLSNFPSFQEYEKPTLTQIEPLIAFPDAESFSLPGITNYFYACWTGQLKIPRAGNYTLFLCSDDGSRLFLDGNQLIDHGGFHRQTEKAGKTDLAEGLHDLKIEYFQNEGLAACTFWWEGPGLKKDIVPRAALSH